MLTRLEVLNLKAIGQPDLVNPKSFLSPYETCLPDLLALEDPTFESLQIGHRSRLGGLTKLRKLRSSFVWTHRETTERLGEREVEWFVNHLTTLRFATRRRIGSLHTEQRLLLVLKGCASFWGARDLVFMSDSMKTRLSTKTCGTNKHVEWCGTN